MNLRAEPFTAYSVLFDLMKILDFLHDLHPTSRLLCLGNRPHDPLQGGKLEILGTGKILPNREQAGKFAADP